MESEGLMITSNFPFLEDLGIFDESHTQKPVSEWSIVKIGSLQARIEAFKASRSHRSMLFADEVPLHKLTTFANDVFEYNGWSTEILEMEIVEDKTIIEKSDQDEEERFSFMVETKIRLMLKDGTYHEDIGRGRAERLPEKSMSLSKAKKESVTNGIKCALESLSQILLVHQENLRTGYYVDGYDDIFT